MKIVKFEGKTEEQYDKIRNQVKDILHKFPEVDFKTGVNVDSLE